MSGESDSMHQQKFTSSFMFKLSSEKPIVEKHRGNKYKFPSFVNTYPILGCDYGSSPSDLSNHFVL